MELFWETAGEMPEVSRPQSPTGTGSSRSDATGNTGSSDGLGAQKLPGRSSLVAA